MTSTTVAAPDGTSQAPQETAGQKIERAVAALATDLLGKKPEEGKFETRKDIYRAIMVNVLSALNGANGQAEKDVRLAAAASKGLDVFTKVSLMTFEFDKKAEAAARALLMEPELAFEAMAIYTEQRSKLEGPEGLASEKKLAYIAVRNEMVGLAKEIAFKNGVHMEQKEAKAPAPLSLVGLTLRQ